MTRSKANDPHIDLGALQASAMEDELLGFREKRLFVLTSLCVALWVYASSHAIAAPLEAGSHSNSACPSQGQAASTRIWVVAGQSQATTFGMNPSTLPATWLPDPQIRIWVSGVEPKPGRWETYRAGVNSAPKGQWGPELQLSSRLRREAPTTRVFIIKHAPGQTGVAFDPRENDWSPQSRGEAWERLRDMVRAALRTCGGQVETIFWMGNHNDGVRQEKADRVAANMKLLIDLSRSEWGPQVNWVIGLPDDTAPYAPIVQRELRALAASEPKISTFETADYETQEDGLHYSARSVKRLGDDFFDGWKALASGK